MIWIDVNESLPYSNNDVLISNGDDTFTVAWYSIATDKWIVADDFLRSENYNSRCSIELDSSYEVKFWAEITPIN